MIEKPIAELEDQQLLDLIGGQRDKSALAELYSRYRHSLGGFLRRKLFEDKLVDEVYNDVMMAVWNKSEGFRGESKVSTWIFGIAYNVCLSHSRKEQKHQVNRTDDAFDDQAEYEDSNLVEHLRAAITELSSDHQTVVEMAYFYGHSMAEISKMIDCPLSTVKTRLFHARQKLKSIMQMQSTEV